MFSLNRGDQYLPSTLPSRTGKTFWSVTRRTSTNEVLIKVCTIILNSRPLLVEIGSDFEHGYCSVNNYVPTAVHHGRCDGFCDSAHCSSNNEQHCDGTERSCSKEEHDSNFRQDLFLCCGAHQRERSQRCGALVEFLCAVYGIVLYYTIPLMMSRMARFENASAVSDHTFRYTHVSRDRTARL